MSWSLHIPSFLVVIQGFRKVSWSQWTLYLWRTWEKRVRPIRRAFAQVKGTCCAGVLTPPFALEICSACRSCDAAWACRGKLTNNKNKFMGRTDLHRRRELLQNESSVCLRFSSCVFLWQQSKPVLCVKAPAWFNTNWRIHRVAPQTYANTRPVSAAYVFQLA